MLKGVAFVIATFSAQIFSAFFTKWLNISLPTSLPVTSLTIVLDCFEIFFMLISLSFIGIWVYDLHRSSLMHTNLKFVCYLISFHISTFNILQIVLIIDKFTNDKYIPTTLKLIITVIHGCARMQFTFDPSAAALERGLATLKVSNYEKATSRKKWVVLMFVKEIFGILAFYILSCSPITIGAVGFGIFWICLLIFTVIIGIILYRANLRSYKTRIGILHLTTRYQTVENIRCLKPVLIYSFLAVIQNIVAFLLLIIMFIHFIAKDYIGGSNYESVINLIVAIFCIFYPLSFLVYSSRIRKFVRNKLNFYRKSNISSKATTITVLSVMGKALTNKNEQNIYFNQLKTAWK